jgi:hypothetical protein
VRTLGVGGEVRSLECRMGSAECEFPHGCGWSRRNYEEEEEGWGDTTMRKRIDIL